MNAQLDELIGELRASLGKLEMAFNAIPLAILYADGWGDIQWCNAAFERLAGRRRLDLSGIPLREALPLRAKRAPLSWSRHPANPAARINAAKFFAYYLIRGPKSVVAIRLSRSPLSKGDRSAGFVFVIAPESTI